MQITKKALRPFKKAKIYVEIFERRLQRTYQSRLAQSKRHS